MLQKAYHEDFFKVPTGMGLGLNTFSEIRGAIFALAPGAVFPRYATGGEDYFFFRYSQVWGAVGT